MVTKLNRVLQNFKGFKLTRLFTLVEGKSIGHYILKIITKNCYTVEVCCLYFYIEIDLFLRDKNSLSCVLPVFNTFPSIFILIIALKNGDFLLHVNKIPCLGSHIVYMKVIHMRPYYGDRANYTQQICKVDTSCSI